MKTFLLSLAGWVMLAGFSAPAQAQVHKCMINGAVSYQSTPCPEGSASGNVDLRPSMGRSKKSTTAQSGGFRCDGRTRCSQMTSCEEAKFFLANCPGVKMDGDRDGRPCEDQWCGY
ncbi:excalibur calcium-binding domain-containing protein [Zoogloea sp.]|uniref:excalibur calcium-binding domain-containing protein n=1 Tax=Zoogloea sp. TaxID=49181 RepID=UPI0035AD9C49